MKVAIVLGNRINDDGSFTDIMVKRLELAKELYDNKEIDKIIVSGGIANEKVGFSEAERMKEYLVNRSVPDNLIILEDKSLSTRQNALFSVPIAKKLKADKIFVVSTIEHFIKYNYNVIKYFADAIGKSNIRLMVYTNSEDYCEYD